MIYKLFNEPTYSPIEQILINRGIPKNKIEEWLNAGWPQINSPGLFGKEKVKHAIELMNNAILSDREIGILVD